MNAPDSENETRDEAGGDQVPLAQSQCVRLVEIDKEVLRGLARGEEYWFRDADGPPIMLRAVDVDRDAIQSLTDREADDPPDRGVN